MNDSHVSPAAGMPRERDFGVLERPRSEPPGGYGYVSLLRRSLLRLEKQWARGVLPAHRGCSIEDKHEAEQLWLIGDPITRHDVDKAKNNYRCGSSTCRPGDPMGCAAADSRMKAERSTFVLGRWVAVEGMRAIYGVLDTRGGPAESLSSVLARATSGFDALKATDKGKWHQRAELNLVGGYLWHLGAHRRQGRWIVRRWVFVGMSECLTAQEMRAWSGRVSAGWKVRSAREGGSGAFSGWSRVRGNRQAQIIARVAAGVTRYELRRSGEDRDVRLAARVIEAHSAGGRAWLLEEASIDDPWFVEYAHAFEGRPTWQSSQVSSSAPEWQAALQDPEFKRIRFSGNHLRRPVKSRTVVRDGKRRPVEGDIW